MFLNFGSISLAERPTEPALIYDLLIVSEGEGILRPIEQRWQVMLGMRGLRLENGATLFIAHFQQNELFQIDLPQRTYRVSTIGKWDEEIRREGGALFLEQAIRQLRVFPTGEQRIIASFPCHEYRVELPGAQCSVWTTDAPAWYPQFKPMLQTLWQTYWAMFINELPPLPHGQIALEGFVIEQRSKIGQVTVTSTVTTIEAKDVAADRFALPPGLVAAKK